MMTSDPDTPALRVVIVNYRTADLTIDCLASMADQVRGLPGGDGGDVVVVDNASGDGSADRIGEAISDRGWSGWAEVLPLDRNGGFSAGNNAGIVRALRPPAPAFVLLLNSDTIIRPGALSTLLEAAAERPEAGLIGPRLEWPDGRPQISGFRFPSPPGELVKAASTGPLTRLLRRYDLDLGLPDQPIEADWVSFAGVLIRRQALEQVGPLDEGYFMYYEDVDYCLRARRAGWSVLHWPSARVVHLRGGSAPVKRQMAARRRVSPYFYASRARYFAKAYGPIGPTLANLAWTAGRSVSLTRELLGGKAPHTAERQALDIWTHWRTALREPSPAVGNSS